MMHYIYYNVAAGDAFISAVPEDVPHYDYYGEYGSEAEAEEALADLAGPTIWVVFWNVPRGEGYVSPEDMLSGHWRGSRDYPYECWSEHSSKAEAEEALSALKARYEMLEERRGGIT